MFKEITKSENVIGRGSFFQGRLALNTNLKIHGKYEGNLLEMNTLSVGKTGRVKANIKANNVIIEGIVIGNILAKVRVLLYPTARILGNIQTPELIIQNGVVFEGKCRITNEKNPSANQLINDLYNSDD